MVALLSPTVRSVALDFRGWGASTGPDDAAAYSTAHLASDVKAVVRRLGLTDVVIVGHSMGGKVAQAVAGCGSVPGLRGLVLVGSAPPTPLVLPPGMREQQVHAYDNPESAEFVARTVLTASEVSNEAVAAMLADMMKGNMHARAAWPGYVMAEDIVATAKKISVPVLVLGGEKDRVEPVEKLRAEVLSNIERAKLVVLGGVGHMMPLEAPARLAEEIETFVKGL